MRKDDDHARTSARLTVCGCLAGLAVALLIPAAMVVMVAVHGLPTP
ncbi:MULTISPECIES: hypothetical protein [unclassified Streptomyces]|nr:MULTISPECIES: hypothetical protein [unclassified Streptomyces]